MTQKLKIITLAFVSALLIAIALSPGAVKAACQPGEVCGAGDSGASVKSTADSTGSSADLGNGCPTGTTEKNCLAQNSIVHDINIVVNFLGALVGIVVVAMIILGGIQYSMAGNNPSALTAAKKRITNAIIALVAFMLTFAFLQWLIPGGVFS